MGPIKGGSANSGGDIPAFTPHLMSFLSTLISISIACCLRRLTTDRAMQNMSLKAYRVFGEPEMLQWSRDGFLAASLLTRQRPFRHAVNIEMLRTLCHRHLAISLQLCAQHVYTVLRDSFGRIYTIPQQPPLTPATVRPPPPHLIVSSSTSLCALLAPSQTHYSVRHRDLHFTSLFPTGGSRPR